MIRIVITQISILTVFLVLYFSPSVCALTSSDKYQPPEKYLAHIISTIKTYQVNLNTRIYTPSSSDIDPNVPDDVDPDRFMEVNSIVFGESGRKMKIETTFGLSELGIEKKISLIFDGTWLWVENILSKHPNLKNGENVTSVSKIHIPDVSPDPVNEPFNTIYGVTGIGLNRYKDFPGTFNELLSIYNFHDIKTMSESQDIIFYGYIKDRHLNKQNKEEDKILSELKERLDQDTRVCKIWISKINGLIKAYSLGESDKKPSMLVEIEYLSVNKQLPVDTFTYIPPEGIVVNDATSQILKQVEMKKK